MSETAKIALDNISVTVEVVAAYVSNNSVRPTDVPGLIATVHCAPNSLAAGSSAPAVEAVEKATAAQIRKSVTPNALISFIDGRPYKTLKRHLTSHGYTPETYRRAYGLDASYPVVCASYSEQRSNLAKSIGLGVGGGRAARSVKVAA